MSGQEKKIGRRREENNLAISLFVLMPNFPALEMSRTFQNLTFPPHFDILFSIFISQIFHGVWTIAFFCLNLVDTSRAVLPNASCLLAGYLPATTVLHILLIPNDYPLEFIIVDAVGTFLAIITMFLLLRMECTGETKRKNKLNMSDYFRLRYGMS